MTKFATRVVAPLLAVAAISFGAPAVAGSPPAVPAGCRQFVATLTAAGVEGRALDAVAQACTDEQVAAMSSIDSTILDRFVCPVLAGLAGTYAGVIVIYPEGDVWAYTPRGYVHIWDCPPYDPASGMLLKTA